MSRINLLPGRGLTYERTSRFQCIKSRMKKMLAFSRVRHDNEVYSKYQQHRNFEYNPKMENSIPGVDSARLMLIKNCNFEIFLIEALHVAEDFRVAVYENEICLYARGSAFKSSFDSETYTVSS